MKKYSRTSWSIMVYSSYLLILGGLIIFIPHEFMSVLDYTFEEEEFCRIAGLLAFALGFKGFAGGLRDDRKGAQVDVYTRTMFSTGLTIFVLMGLVETQFVGLAIIDYVASAWTQISIFLDKKKDAAEGA